MYSRLKKGLAILFIGVLALSVTACSWSTAGKAYPDKPIVFTLPVSAGNGLDAIGRSLVKIFDETKSIPVAMSVENKPGGGQVVGTIEYADKQKNNDYNLLVTSTPLILNNLKKEGNNPISFRDLTPLARLEADYGVIAVATDSKYNDLKSVMDDLKADPTNVVVAGGTAVGSFDHLNIIIASQKAGVDPKTVKYVYFGGGAEAMTALLGNNAAVLTSTLSETLEFVKSGKVRILGVAAPTRLAEDLKDIPTYKEQGIDLELTNWRGILGPKGMSPEAKKYWDEKLKEVVATEAWQNELKKKGVMNGYINSEDWVKVLEQEEAMYKEIYVQFGLAK